MLGSINTPETKADSLQNVQPQTAGQMNGQAQETVQSIVGEAVNQPTDEEQKQAERLSLLESLRITTATEVPAEEPALSVDGVGFFALNDIHGVKAKQKQGKTTALKIMLAALLKGQVFRVKSELQEPLVLWLDTEQKAADVKLIITDVKQLTGLDDEYIDSHLMLFPLRKMNYETLLSDTRLLIAHYRPQVVIIDGVVDFVASFNDERTSRQLIHDLLVLCEERHCAIINVLHENKAADDRNMRGHLGTVLSQAAGTVLACEKSRQGIITVSCSDPRHGTTPPWSFRFDEDGNIVDADKEREAAKKVQREKKEEQRAAEKEKILSERLQAALTIIRDNGGCMKTADLNQALQQKLSLSRPAISKFLNLMVEQGKLHKADGLIRDTPETALPF
jgi:uncharacterized membrane protein